jgi:hypothetical protein
MPDSKDKDISKIKEKIRKQFEDRAELADKFMGGSDGKAALKQSIEYLEKFYNIKIKTDEQDPSTPFKPSDPPK